MVHTTGHSARLRGAIIGKSKSDVIDADVLTRAGQVFELAPLTLPEPAQLALGPCPRVVDTGFVVRRLRAA